MSAVAAILLDVAAKIGAPLVKGILQKHVGGAAGEIGGTVIDAIAGKVGVEPEQLSTVPREALAQAVLEVERITPDLIMAEVEAQKESNRLMLAEMQKDGFISWGWRPAGMWLVLVCIVWYVLLVPLLNTLLAAFGSRTVLALIVDFGDFVPIFMTYAGLYMGGNTVIRAVGKNTTG